MPIDLIITELDVGGAERALTRLAIGLQQGGEDVRVFSLGPLPHCQSPQDDKDSLVRELRAHEIEVTSGEGRGVSQLPPVYRRLRRWLQQRPDALCQSFLFHANVLTRHALRESVIGRRRASVWVAGVRIADPNRFRIRVEGAALRDADHVVCVSHAVEVFSRQRYRLPDHRLSVIPNSVDVRPFRNATPTDWTQRGWSADADVVLFIGRLCEQKNLDILQRTLDRFAPEAGKRKLVIAGGGPLRQELEQWAETVPGDRVRVLPWQPDVAPLIAACRLLVLPSHYEGMPNVVLEAMAGGKPVVCSRVEGSLELIGEDPDQGFDPGNESQLTQRINRFLGEPDFAASVGVQNQRRVEEEFSVQRMVSSYRNRYGSLTK